MAKTKSLAVPPEVPIEIAPPMPVEVWEYTQTVTEDGWPYDYSPAQSGYQMCGSVYNSNAYQTVLFWRKQAG